MARTEKNVKSAKSKYRKVSVWNWMGTLILCSIPGVNLIALILFAIFGKAQAKRSYALAMLLLMVLATALTVAAFLVFDAELSQFAANLRGGDAVSLLIPVQG